MGTTKKQPSLIILLLFVFLTTSLTACSTVKRLEIFNKEVERTPLNLSEPEPLKLDKVPWILVTEENVEEIFAELKERKIDPVLFALTDDGYAVISLNNAKVRNYIIKEREIIKQYKEYYEKSDDGTTGAGSNSD